MQNISKETLERLRKEYPVGCRVELTKMNDPYRPDLAPGCRGTVTCVDDAGSIHVDWDIRSSLAVIFGEDACRKLDPVTITCHGKTDVWEDRKDAIRFYREGAAVCEGAERDRYINILLQLTDGQSVCSDADTED